MAKKVSMEAAYRPLEQPVARPASAFAGVPGEVVAAISGAVAMLCGNGARVVGVQQVCGSGQSNRAQSGRSAWSMAGLLDTTRAF